MMGERQKVAFALLRYALCATESSQEVRELITGERLEQVYQLLKMHDLALTEELDHIIYIRVIR